MEKFFNVTGKCYKDKHYMVDISQRVAEIKKMVDRGEYFCINRGRQYGKTTTIQFLTDLLEQDYCVFSISFEGLGDSSFETTEAVGQSFFECMQEKIEYELVKNLSCSAKEFILSQTSFASDKQLSLRITQLVKKNAKPIVIIIDEVDQAGNYQTFIKFLGLLRDKYLERGDAPTFHSVILVGVYDIKNLKLKMRPDDEHQYNSPWNIASEFKVNMDLMPDGIRGMLEEYEADHHTGMDCAKMAQLLYDYTSGYPFLVSRLCKIIDEDLDRRWNDEGFLDAVKHILNERNTLFDDMNKKISDFTKMRDMLKRILFSGEGIAYNPDDRQIEIAQMFNFVKNDGGKLAMSNRIFEMRLYNFFVFEDSLNEEITSDGSKDKPEFITNGRLNMTAVLDRFAMHFNEIYDSKDERFIEKQGRKFFLFYLKPIINGVGNYYIEAQTRNERRMDLVVDYNGERFVIEMKIWHGDTYNKRGEQQLTEFLDYYHINKGYLLSF
ncbi:MAG: AAA-like domain-containing protein, partial [Spirochaetales bacterium]|nr:AAA-like domain-containing protein [Spirochaetales bacterium]